MGSRSNWFVTTQQKHYRIAENVGGIKHWQIQLFGLFGEENFGEWPPKRYGY